MPSRESKKRFREGARIALHSVGLAGLFFLVFLLLYTALQRFSGFAALSLAAAAGVAITGLWLMVRLMRLAARHVLWRLRNRLVVTYLFIAVVPFLLVAALAGLTGYWLVNQMAIYLVTSELDRRIDSLASITESVVRTDPESRPAVMERTIDLFYRDQYPGIEVLLREGPGRQIRYPEGVMPPAPLNGWKPTSGVMVRDGRFYLWSYAKTGTGDITVTAPLTREFLARLVPKLGLVDVGQASAAPARTAAEARGAGATRSRPPAQSRFDPEINWFATLPDADWNHPAQESTGLFIAVRSRVSAVLATVFSRRRADIAQGYLELFLILNLVIFVVVEIISLVIGIRMASTITGAVHRLYEGTQKVIEGDFSHRIEVKGRDQLAELGQSFNRMTENIERLLVVAKEKERLQSEIEIAREVQGQLFPREAPQLRTLRVRAVCQPARLVSGDYYDYDMLDDTQIALAIADVAGKGISAALLMAALQSSLRAQLQGALDLVPAGGNGHGGAGISTSHVVSNLNRQLHSTTSLEKYATFCLGIYDEPASTFTYTNAGHLPPLLVRNRRVERLDVNGTVVGAFPFSEYNESRVILRPGDLLVFYTDGITEPENEYEQMFSEDRLVDLLIRNADRDEEDIIRIVLDSVRQWTASEELQDDMTLLLARRV